MNAVQMQSDRRLTGWHVLAMFIGGFSVIIAVNLTLAVNAVRTFPGTETASSYIASQSFNADRAAQQDLGWTLTTALTETALRLAVQDADQRVVRPDIISATLGRATTVADDMTPMFDWDGKAWIALVTAGPGNWNLRIEMRASDGTDFRRRIPLRVLR